MTVLPEMNRRDAEWEEIEIYLWVCVQRKSINCTRQNLNYDFLKPPTGTRVQSCSYSQVRLRRQHPEDIVACCEKSSPSLDITNMCRGGFCVTWLVTGEVLLLLPPPCMSCQAVILNRFLGQTVLSNAAVFCSQVVLLAGTPGKSIKQLNNQHFKRKLFNFNASDEDM